MRRDNLSFSGTYLTSEMYLTFYTESILKVYLNKYINLKISLGILLLWNICFHLKNVACAIDSTITYNY